jgi:hypothetical protein
MRTTHTHTHNTRAGEVGGGMCFFVLLFIHSFICLFLFGASGGGMGFFVLLFIYSFICLIISYYLGGGMRFSAAG